MKLTRSTILGISLALSLLGSTAKADFTIDFDGILSGSPANAAAPSGVSFFYGVFTPDNDESGDPIPGTEKWRIDPTAPDVSADDPNTFGSGNAPSAPNALNAVFQPALMLFDVAFNIQSFALVLDNDTFGDSLSIDFFDLNDLLLLSVAIDQAQPGFSVNTGAVANVSKIVLPGGAFYDSFDVTGAPVPEPSTYALIALGGALAVARRKWTRRATLKS